jgi:predicted small lipoprotein YifL
MRKVMAMTALVALTACGAKAPLAPPEGASLPVAPYGAPEGEENAPTAEQLLELDALAAPERSVELRRRSEEREDDPFDLPPQE